MKSSLILDLIRAHSRGSDGEFSEIVERLALDEDRKGNARLAMEIRRAARGIAGAPDAPADGAATIADAGTSQGDAADLVTVVEPRISLGDVILDDAVRGELEQIVWEWTHPSALPPGIPPTNRILMVGPPGCGKTMTAEALSGSLGLGMAYVHLDSLISMYMGRTGSNIASVFGFARRTGYVLFLDEFDAIARDRGLDDVGEAKRVLATVLQNLDSLPVDVMVVAATNMADDLDPAVTRRFGTVLRFPMPDRDGRVWMVETVLGRFVPGCTADTDAIADMTASMSYSELESLLVSVIRRRALRGTDGPIGPGDVWSAMAVSDPADMLGRMRASGMTLREMERVTGIPRSTLSYRLRRSQYDDE